MNFTILINASPLSQGSNTAYQYCCALIKKGCELKSIFFYSDGVLHGNKFIELPKDEWQVIAAWQTFSREQNIKLKICVSAAQRRGITEENLAEQFEITGLGQLMEAIQKSDRLVEFNE